MENLKDSDLVFPPKPPEDKSLYDTMPADFKAWVIDAALDKFANPEWNTLTQNLLDNCHLSLDDKMELQIIIEDWDFVIGHSENIFTFFAREAKYVWEAEREEQLENIRKGLLVVVEYIETLQKGEDV